MSNNMNPREFARLNRILQTTAEQFFWSKVRNRRFIGLKFQRQFLINHVNILGKNSYFLADFYCHQFKAIVEIDGKIHRNQIEYDEERTVILNSMGIPNYSI